MNVPPKAFVLSQDAYQAAGLQTNPPELVGQFVHHPVKIQKNQLSLVSAHFVLFCLLDTPCAAGARSDGLRPHWQQRISHVSDLKQRASG